MSIFVFYLCLVGGVKWALQITKLVNPWRLYMQMCAHVSCEHNSLGFGEWCGTTVGRTDVPYPGLGAGGLRLACHWALVPWIRDQRAQCTKTQCAHKMLSIINAVYRAIRGIAGRKQGNGHWRKEGNKEGRKKKERASQQKIISREKQNKWVTPFTLFSCLLLYTLLTLGSCNTTFKQIKITIATRD